MDSNQTVVWTYRKFDIKKVLLSTRKDTGLAPGAQTLINQQILQQLTVLSRQEVYKLTILNTVSEKK